MYKLTVEFEDNTTAPKYTQHELQQGIGEVLEKDLYLTVISLKLTKEAKPNV